ncbi:ribonuclease P protein subunit p40-like [Panulirus ornatus]|uniref:ribonuclease P protein subunit p40-like n=1 Tax=Panulirus ornatus TaxID=150431 RepID=UPI003A87F81B
MLNPEVVKFPAPESQVYYSQQTWDDTEHSHSWQQVIDDHPFNTKVSLLLPDTPSIPKLMSDVLTEDTEFYLIKQLPLLQLCTSTFLQAFVNRGQLYAISCDTRLDLDDSASLTPNGRLLLLLNKFTYQELRLNGMLSAHILRKPLEKYVVEVNLKEPSFRPGKPNYNKVITTFTEVQLAFNFWFNWVPHDKEVCPSSIAKYFNDLGYSVEEVRPFLGHSIMTEAAMPLLGKTEEEVDPEDLLEWIGCQTLGIKLNTEGTTVCEVVTPEPNIQVNNLCTLQCTGFFSPNQLQLMIHEIRLWLNQRSEVAVPWLSMTVFGHPDSLISWGTTEHSYRTNGDNLYSLIILRNQLRIYKVSGSRKPQRMYVKSNKNK